MPITIPQKPETVRPLSLSEENALDEKIRTLMDERDGVEVVQGLTHIAKRSKEVINRDISHLMQVKKMRGVVRAEGKEREEITKEIKSIEERVQVDMPNLNTFQNTGRKHGTAYLKLKRWCDIKNSDEKFKRLVERWKSLRRRLEPEDTDIANVMYLFPEKGW